MGPIGTARFVAVAIVLGLALGGCGPVQPAKAPLPAGWVRHEVKLLDTPYVALSAPLTWRQVDGEPSGDSILSLTGPQDPDPMAGAVHLLRYRDAPTSDQDWVTWTKKTLGFDSVPGAVADEERVTFAAGEAFHEHVSLGALDLDWYALPPRDDIMLVVFVAGASDRTLARAIAGTLEFLEPLPSPS